MKELSIEEKARRYDKALEKISKYVKDEYGCTRLRPDDIFPELKDSDDERIRKGIIEGLKAMKENFKTISSIKLDDAIAWLEKQGDKDKPTYSTYSKDVQLTQEEYDKRRVSDEAIIKEVEAYKKGLKDAQKIFENQGEQSADNQFTPEQASILDKHIDKFLEQKPADTEKGAKGNEREIPFTEQNLAWSEEDENRINRLIAYFEDKESFTAEDDIVYANWLKSLKDRVLPQSRQEWSEEDKETLEDIITSMTNLKDSATSDTLRYIYNSKIDWLKSLRPQNRWKPSKGQMKALNTCIMQEECNITGIKSKNAEGKLGKMIKEKTATEEEILHEPK